MELAAVFFIFTLLLSESFFFLVWHYGSATHSAAVIQNRHSHVNYRFSHRLAATSNLKALISSQFTPLGEKKPPYYSTDTILHFCDLLVLLPLISGCVCVCDRQRAGCV